MKSIIFAVLFTFISFQNALASDIKIVSWNAKAAIYEKLEDRLKDFKKLTHDLNPDIIILIEITGFIEIKIIAEAFGWSKYHAVVSNFSKLSTSAFPSLEVAVISRIPIIKVIEYDASRDGVHKIFDEQGEFTAITEEKLSSMGIKGFGDPLNKWDRGTLRVDLNNGLSLFPVHLKSNSNGACSKLKSAIRNFEKFDIHIPDKARIFFTDGFDQATDERIKNAKKRERVMAAVVKVANQAVKQNRIPLIAGDFNTSFEPGKFGS